MEALSLALQQYLRHRSNMSQHILLRLWAWKDGTVSALIVVGLAMDHLIAETHSFESRSGNLAHLGQ